MQYNKTEDALASIVDILKHIDNVQRDVLELSERTIMAFHTCMEEHRLQHNAETIKAFQYQDIITQQIDSVSEAIGSIEKNITIYLHAVREDRNMLGGSIEKLSNKLAQSLKTAQEKRGAFSGNAIDPDNGKSIEFF